jgi:hypothetical protein
MHSISNDFIRTIMDSSITSDPTKYCNLIVMKI